MKTFKIHLIRHGLPEGAETGQYIGHTDVPLSEYGKKQLRDMKNDYEYPAVGAVISSPLDRCLETAKDSPGEEKITERLRITERLLKG